MGFYGCSSDLDDVPNFMVVWFAFRWLLSGFEVVHRAGSCVLKASRGLNKNHQNKALWTIHSPSTVVLCKSIAMNILRSCIPLWRSFLLLIWCQALNKSSEEYHTYQICKELKKTETTDWKPHHLLQHIPETKQYMPHRMSFCSWDKASPWRTHHWLELWKFAEHVRCIESKVLKVNDDVPNIWTWSAFTVKGPASLRCYCSRL